MIAYIDKAGDLTIKCEKDSDNYAANKWISDWESGYGRVYLVADDSSQFLVAVAPTPMWVDESQKNA